MRTPRLSVAGFLSYFTIVSAAPSQCQDGAAQCQDEKGVDYQSLMQSASVRVDLLNAKHFEPREAVSQVLPFSGSDDPRLHALKKPLSEPPAKSILSTLSGSVSSARAMSGISFLAEHIKTKGGGMGTVLLLLLFLGCLALVCLVIICPNLAKKRKEGGEEADGFTQRPLSGVQRPSTHMSPSQFAPRMPQGSMVSVGPPFATGMSNRPSMSAFSDRNLTSMTHGGGHLSTHSPQPPVMMPQTDHRLGLAPLSKQAPPPLCPTLVMPVCEARFGVPMTDLANLGTEGMINIVGLSGNPLLRAVKRNRTLEICMPEKNSAPRATISPSASADSYEIRGMKGLFYGYLQVQTTGTCYVIKDGQTVLLLDGDTENLQLGVKSGLGSQLASVRCSAEPFGGVEHVEIRVEPGVDTVLVLAVVLGVLLLCDR